MNQENYKEIAKIIKKRLDFFKNWSNNTSEHAWLEAKHYALELANYFEKEAYKEAKNKCSIFIFKKEIIEEYTNWNKQQFLKDCGVEE